MNIALELQEEETTLHTAMARQLCSVMKESLLGFAVFDREARLLACNPAYRAARGLDERTSSPGTPFVDIIRSTLAISRLDFEHVKPLVEEDLRRLKAGGVDKIVGQRLFGNDVRIARHINAQGFFVETIDMPKARRCGDDLEMGDELRSMAQSRSRLSDALDNLPDGFAVFDPQGVLIAINERYRELQPHIADALQLGSSHESIIRAVYRSGQLQQMEMTEEEFVDFAQEQLENPSEATVDQLKNGRFVRYVARKLADGSIVFLQSDVTELQKKQQETVELSQQIERDNQRLEIAIENMFAGFILFDHEQRMIMCNQIYRDMFGFSNEFAVPGKTRQQLMDHAIANETFAEGYNKQAQEVVTQSTKSQTYMLNRYYLKDGRILQTRFADVPDVGSMLLFLDVTDQVRAEEQLQINNQKLARSNEELQSFAYVASHDLQEPLRKIETFGDRLLKKYKDQLPEDGQMYMDRIENSATRMRQLINDLLSFSRVTSNANAFDPIDLNEILEGVLSDIQVRLEETNGTVEFGALPIIDADAVQMRQLFQNLISNALKFSREGVAPLISVSAETNTPDHGATPTITLKFCDNGIGFENRFKDQIFAIFQRLHGRMEYEGTGIGLATCRKIVERHDGRIDADGKDGEGATFIVELPIKQAN